MTAQPWQVVAVTRYDGWVTLSSHETKQARDTALSHEREQFATNGTDDVIEVIAVNDYAAHHQAEDADIALALVAHFDSKARTQARMKGL